MRFRDGLVPKRITVREEPHKAEILSRLIEWFPTVLLVKPHPWFAFCHGARSMTGSLKHDHVKS